MQGWATEISVYLKQRFILVYKVFKSFKLGPFGGQLAGIATVLSGITWRISCSSNAVNTWGAERWWDQTVRSVHQLIFTTKSGNSLFLLDNRHSFSTQKCFKWCVCVCVCRPNRQNQVRLGKNAGQKNKLYMWHTCGFSRKQVKSIKL